MKKNKKGMSISSKLYGLIGILVLVTIVVSVCNVIFIKQLRMGTASIAEDQIRDLKHVTSIIADIQETQKYFYSYLTYENADKKAEALEGYNKGKEDIVATFTEFASYVPVEADRNQLMGFLDFVQQGFDGMDNVIALSDSGAATAEIEAAMDEMQETVDAIAFNMNEMGADCESRIAASKVGVYGTFGTNDTLAKAFLAVIVVLGVLIFVVIQQQVVGPLKKSSRMLNKIIRGIEDGEGDLTERMEVKRHDEIGQISIGINKFLETLQGAMTNIKRGSGQLEQSVNNIGIKIREADDKVANTSATMEEMSAGMEEVTATVIEITENVEEVEQEMASMTQQTQEGLDFAREIKEKADELKENALSSQKSTNAMVEEITQGLQRAIEESRRVDKINELTGNILNISSQTNLLALNASIEAARAGEAGKGFAVVAEEIRVLADDSKNTANGIQEVSEMVTQSVNELSENSMRMLEFIHTVILKDYQTMVGTGESYHDDAVRVEEMMNYIRGNAEQVTQTMETLVSAIEGVKVTISESASGVENVAENSTELVSSIGEISVHMDDNQQIAESLQAELDRFKNI